MSCEGGFFVLDRFDLYGFDLSFAETRGPGNVKDYEVEDLTHCEYTRAKK